MPLGIWSFEHQFLGWKDLWNSSSLYCNGRRNSLKWFHTGTSIWILGWMDLGTSNILHIVAEDALCIWTFQCQIWSGRISGTSSLRCWSGWCPFLSPGCLQTKWQLHNTSSLRTQDSKQLLHSHKKVIIILMKLAFSANKNNSYIVIGYNKNNKNYDNSNL